MHRLLGLSRDPFAPLCDGELYWESEARAQIRERVETLLEAERSVWLRGEPDSGRRTLLARAVTAVADPARPVAWCDALPANAEAGVLSCLARVAGRGAGGTGRQPAETVYGELVAGFCRGGSPILLLGTDGGGAGDREELRVLSSLRLVGKPLVLLALWGATEPPADGVTRIDLPAPSARDLSQFLAHRAAASGEPDLFAPARLQELAARARGFGHALALAREELARLAFLGRPAPEPPASQASGTPGRVLDPAELAEVDRLLGALDPGNASP